MNTQRRALVVMLPLVAAGVRAADDPTGGDPLGSMQ
jgi:hypothetical protein